ncbi:hypothetical protein A2U01_0048900, partial [Trifolium medium]|nr:hypothetical protein [Trifolium medium]
MLILSSLPTSLGKLPLNEFFDKFNKFVKEERLKTSMGMVPLRLFCERS